MAALAKYRHFGRAADACAISQPALSMQIRDLERSLCANVVERRPGDVILTEVGAVVAARAETILTAVNDLVDVAMHHSQPLVGRLRLGVIPTIAPYVLPGILPELQQRYPELRLEVRETQTQTLLDELSSGALDAALLALPLEDDQHIETRALVEVRLLLAVPANDESYGSRISTHDVDQLRLILLEKGHCLRDQTLAFCAMPRWSNAQKRGETRLDASSLATVTQMVANGYGVTLLPEIATDLELRDKRVKVVRFHDPEPSRIIGLAWRRTSPRVQDFQALGDIIVEMFSRPRDE